jgi:DNA-binding NtrC family response regulator
MSKILIVDDQPCLRQLLAEELTLEGYHMASSGNAESAKGQLLSFRPDVVLLDLYFDRPEGFELFEDIKMKYPYLPVIIVTAHDSYMEDPRLSHADGYAIKGIRFWDELKRQIAHALRQKPSIQEFEAKTYFPAVSAAQ